MDYITKTATHYDFSPSLVDFLSEIQERRNLKVYQVFQQHVYIRETKESIQVQTLIQGPGRVPKETRNKPRPPAPQRQTARPTTPAQPVKYLPFTLEIVDKNEASLAVLLANVTDHKSLHLQKQIQDVQLLSLENPLHLLSQSK